MQALEVRHLGLVTSLGESFESGLNKCSHATTKNSLFAEQIGFGFFGEGGFDDTSAGATDCIGVGKRNIACVAGCVLLHGDEARNAATLGVGTTHEMAWTLRRGHHNVDASGRNDAIKTNVETVSEEQRIAFGEIRRDVGVIHRLLFGVRKKNHDHVSPLGGISNRHHGKSFGFSFGLRGRTLTQTHDDVHAGVFEVERMGMALRAVANDSDLAIGDK